MTGHARLSSAMQAVDVYLEIQGQPVRALIPRTVLETVFQAGPTPQSWLNAYSEHEQELDAAIERRFAAKPQDWVVMRNSDFGELDSPQEGGGAGGN